MGLGFSPMILVIFTLSSPTTERRYSSAESMVSSGLRRMLETMEAEGGMTLDALLPFIWVKATVVRTSAFSSPPDLRHTKSSRGPKHHRLANSSL